MSKKSTVKAISLVLSVLILLTALPVGAFAAETGAVATESVTQAKTDQADLVVSDENADSAEIWSPSEPSLSSDVELDSESDPEPLSQAELTTIIQNGKMERISVDNVPEIVGFETAKSRNHVARAYEKEEDDLNSLVFLNEDGTYTKYIYDYPVKFTDTDGKIKDKSLQVVADTNGGYKNTQGSSATLFSEKMADGISLTSGELSASIVPRQPTIVRPKPDLSQMASKKLNSLLLSTEKVNSLDNKTVSYYYNDSTTIEYTMTYMGFKEDIVVSEYTGQTEYAFTLKTNGLALTENDGNFYLTDAEGNNKMSLGSVIIFTADERNNTFGSMTAETVTENQEYTVTIHVDADYLKDEKTVYPIRIDPTLELVNQGDSVVEDVVVNSNNTVSHRTTEALKIGKNSDGTYSRILIKFNYDFGLLTDGPLKIHRAYVEMRDLMCEPERMTVMSEMFLGTNWSESSEWSSFERGTHTHYMASMPIYYDKGNAFTEKHRYSISILDAMKYWVAEANNTPNYHHESSQGGIMIRAYDTVEQGSTAIAKYFASSQYSISSYRPSLSVTYYDTHTQYSDPFGHLDAVTENSIRGWVWCVDLPEQSVPVTIYLKNKTTNVEYPGITLSGEETALYRPDVHSAGYGTGKYGFNYTIDWNKYPAGVYEVTAKWHSMNGTGLEYNLFNAPREYTKSGFSFSTNDLKLETGATATIPFSSCIGVSPSSITWHSSNTNAATISDTGVITAIRTGVTVITASSGTDVETCIVTVGDINFTPSMLRISENKAYWIREVGTNNYLTVENGDWQSGSNIKVYDPTINNPNYTTTDIQHPYLYWKFEEVNSEYIISPYNSLDMGIAVKDGNDSNNANVELYPSGHDERVRWKIIPSEDGFIILSDCSSYTKALKTSTNSNVRLFNSLAATEWEFVEVNCYREDGEFAEYAYGHPLEPYETLYCRIDVEAPTQLANEYCTVYKCAHCEQIFVPPELQDAQALPPEHYITVLGLQRAYMENIIEGDLAKADATMRVINYIRGHYRKQDDSYDFRDYTGAFVSCHKYLYDEYDFYINVGIKNTSDEELNRVLIETMADTPGPFSAFYSGFILVTDFAETGEIDITRAIKTFVYAIKEIRIYNKWKNLNSIENMYMPFGESFKRIGFTWKLANISSNEIDYYNFNYFTDVEYIHNRYLNSTIF